MGCSLSIQERDRRDERAVETAANRERRASQARVQQQRKTATKKASRTASAAKKAAALRRKGARKVSLKEATSESYPLWTMEGTYAGKVVSIYDGDTCTIAIGAPFWATFKVRLLGIDTAEMRGSKDEPEESRKSRVALALKARNYLAAQTTSLQVDAECALKSEEWQNYIAENRRLVRLDIRGLDKYGRPLAIIHAADSPTGSPSTAEMLVDAGLAVAYGGGTKLNVVEQLTREESGGAQRERMLSSLREILYSCQHACQDGGQGRQKRQELGIDVKIEEEEEEGEE